MSGSFYCELCGRQKINKKLYIRKIYTVYISIYIYFLLRLNHIGIFSSSDTHMFSWSVLY